MRTQHRLEGPDLEQLLAEARAEHGHDVTIVEANKIRSGGFGGFFAREGFEVVIELDEDAGESAAGRSILDLADAVDDGPGPLGVGADSAAALLEAVAEQRARGDAPITPSSSPISTDGAAFAEVLSRITGQNGSATASDEDAPFQPYTDRAAGAPGRVVRADRPAPDGEPPRASTATIAPTAEPSTRSETSLRVRSEPRAEEPARTSERFLGGRPVVDLDVDGLSRLGLPHGYLNEPGTARDRMSALIELAKRFPQAEPLPMTSDALIVLVGDRSGMQESVDWVHDTLRIDVASMLVATRRETRMLALSRRIDDAEDAIVKRRSLRRRQDPIVVAIDEPVGRRGISWARAVLHALEPTVVWGVVDAHRKSDDVADWCERLGGVDAIALNNTEETASPAEILCTGVPISLLDGRPATPVRWAAVLDERLRAA